MTGLEAGALEHGVKACSCNKWAERCTDVKINTLF